MFSLQCSLLIYHNKLKNQLAGTSRFLEVLINNQTKRRLKMYYRYSLNYARKNKKHPTFYGWMRCKENALWVKIVKIWNYECVPQVDFHP